MLDRVEETKYLTCSEGLHMSRGIVEESGEVGAGAVKVSQSAISDMSRFGQVEPVRTG